MSERRWAAMAETAMAYWGGAAETPRLVKAGENVVFEVRLRDGRHGALRLHRPGYNSRAAIEAELEWAEALAAAGQPVPPPIRTVKQKLTARAGERIASLVGWVEGRPIGSAERRLEGTEAEQQALMESVGRLIAGVHNATDALAPSAAARRAWDNAGFLGDRPNWGRFWENPAFDAGERAGILAARDVAGRALAAYAAAGGDFGLIHADCLRENILRDGDRLAIIDFDDSGTGFRIYDLATAVVQSLEEPSLSALVAGVLDGYRALRPLGVADERALVLFVTLRTFASAGWIATRAGRDDPRQRLYAERALRMAAHMRAGTSPW